MSGVARIVELGLLADDGRVGEVEVPADVVAVQVRADDVAHIRGSQAELLELRRNLLARLHERHADPLVGLAPVLRDVGHGGVVDAGVDDDDPIGVVDDAPRRRGLLGLAAAEGDGEDGAVEDEVAGVERREAQLWHGRHHRLARPFLGR